jgi:hypothetical protein
VAGKNIVHLMVPRLSCIFALPENVAGTMSLSSILFGSTSHHFEQFEGTLSPSDKADGQYRLDGDVVVVRSLL